MKKFAWLFFPLLLSAHYRSDAQDTTRRFPVKMQAVSASVHAPLGNFSETHFAGAGIQYERYGNNISKRTFSKQVFSFTANGGIAIFSGKKENVGTSTYTYPLFTFIHTYAGLAWRPGFRYQFSLTGGPAIGIYNGHVEFNIGAKLDAQYLISKRLSAGPAIRMMKEKGSDPLWAGSLGIHYIF